MTGVQQKFILARSGNEMELAADKKVIRELNRIEEGQVVAPKSKSPGGAKVTHITAKSKKRWFKNRK